MLRGSRPARYRRLDQQGQGARRARHTVTAFAAVALAVGLPSLASYRIGLARGSGGGVGPSAKISAGSPVEKPGPGAEADGGGKTTRRAFVCITGQLPRVELSNKVDHLFRPWVEQYGVHIDVALVLAGTDHVSVERRKRDEGGDGGSGESRSGDWGGGEGYRTLGEVRAELEALGPGVVVLNADDSLSVQSSDPILNPTYVRQRDESDPHMSHEDTLERVRNHVRQFESLAACGRHLTEALSRGTGNHYDVIHRIRDDSGYYRPVDFDHVMGLVTNRWPPRGSDRVIVSSHCAEHRGINDRGSFVSPAAAHTYFHAPLARMYGGGPIAEEVTNTETFLLAAYGDTCKLVSTDSFHVFRQWQKPDGGGVAYSQSAMRCIEIYYSERDGVDGGDGDEGPTFKKRRCKDFSDGGRYCIYYDQKGKTYGFEEVDNGEGAQIKRDNTPGKNSPAVATLGKTSSNVGDKGSQKKKQKETRKKKKKVD